MCKRRRLQVPRLILWVLIAVGLVSAACSVSGDGGPDADPTVVYAPDFELRTINVNIDMSDTGFDPAAIHIPAGRSVQLVLRNRGNTEHHYRVIGLEPAEMIWLALEQPDVAEAGVSEEDHESHHSKAFVDFRGTSPAGVKPTLSEVHAYAGGREVDVVRFFALTTGVFEVECVLHPEAERGTITVFAP